MVYTGMLVEKSMEEATSEVAGFESFFLLTTYERVSYEQVTD